jgi:glutamyl-tRNA reductase
MNNRVIARYRAVLKDVQTSELERLYRRLPELDGASRQAIGQFADRVVSNMIDAPLQSLRSASNSASQEALLESLQQLFQLEKI